MDDVTERTCGICLEESKDPLDLPCGHSFCDGCLDEWRSRYGVEDEMRRKCPICRAMIPPSKEMVTTLLMYRARKQELEDKHDTSSQFYHETCRLLAHYEERVGVDWDGVTVLEEKNSKPAVEMPKYILKAAGKGDIKSVLKWINANRTEDRVNANASAKAYCTPLLSVAAISDDLALMALLLQLGADIDYRTDSGHTTISIMLFTTSGDVNERVRLLLSWGAGFFQNCSSSKEKCISQARRHGNHDLANLLESELGGRRCEIVNISSRPELNRKTCVADEYLPNSNQYRVTLETKSKEMLVLGTGNLKRRDRTPQDCGYYIEFKNGRTIRHDFDSSAECQAFVAAMKNGETQPVVTEEAEARAEQVAAELLSELGLYDSSNSVPAGGDKAKKSKKKKGGKKKKK